MSAQRLISRKAKKQEVMSANATRVLHALRGDLYSRVRSAVVVQRRGDKLLVEDSATRRVLECEQRNSLQKEHVVCGDRVFYQLARASSASSARGVQGEGEEVRGEEVRGVVVGRHARRNLLLRPDPLHWAAKKMKVKLALACNT
jgi:putative ribosome biogenesis GTPase RsgA